ncbi:MAG: cell division protein ZapA [Bacillota bacterium]|nr:cell division protein ZapA [Bacillota bacterium]
MGDIVKLNICGQSFKVIVEDDEDRIRSVGSKVSAKIKALGDENPWLSSSGAAILSALDYCDDLEKANEIVELLRNQIQDYLQSASANHAEQERLQKEIENLRNQISDLKLKLKNQSNTDLHDKNQISLFEQNKGGQTNGRKT